MPLSWALLLSRHQAVRDLIAEADPIVIRRVTLARCEIPAVPQWHSSSLWATDGRPCSEIAAFHQPMVAVFSVRDFLICGRNKDPALFIMLPILQPSSPDWSWFIDSQQRHFHPILICICVPGKCAPPSGHPLQSHYL